MSAAPSLGVNRPSLKTATAGVSLLRPLEPHGQGCGGCKSPAGPPLDRRAKWRVWEDFLPFGCGTADTWAGHTPALSLPHRGSDRARRYRLRRLEQSITACQSAGEGWLHKGVTRFSRTSSVHRHETSKPQPNGPELPLLTGRTTSMNADTEAPGGAPQNPRPHVRPHGHDTGEPS